MKLRLAVAALLLITGHAHAQDYEIRLNRPSTVGQRQHLVTTATDEVVQTAKVDGQVARSQNEKISIELAGDIEVLAVTPNGKSSKFNLVLEKFVRTDGQGSELLPAGTTVVVEFVGGRTAYKVGGEPTGRQVSRALDAAGVMAYDDSKASDDTVLGTTERKKVGESWTVNGEAARADMAKTGVKVDAATFTGTMTLAEVKQVDGQEATRITGQMAMEGMVPPLPPGVTVSKSLAKAEFDGLFPVDVTKPRLAEGMVISMELEASGTQNGRFMEMSMSKKTTRESKLSAK